VATRTRSEDLQLGAMLLVWRAALKVQAWRGDAVSSVLSLNPQRDTPYPLYERVRARGDVSVSKLGFYATAAHPLVNQVLRDQNFGVQQAPPNERSRQLIEQRHADGLVHPLEDSFLSLDPPAHTRLRRLVSPVFTPRALRDRGERIEQLVHGYLDELATRESFDLIDDFAVRVPIQVICDLLGIPDADHQPFIRWGALLGSSLDGTRTLAEWKRLARTLQEMTAFFRGLIERRRADPGEDLVSELVRQEDLTEEDLIATVGLLLLAGFETTVNLIGNAVVALRERPRTAEWFAANLDRSADLVEEVLRYDPPVQYTIRVPAQTATVGTQVVPRGRPVMLLLAAANRDPAVFERPGEFDPERPNNHEHLAFSAGIHYCVGANLAKLEAGIALRALVERFPRLESAGRVQRRRSRNIKGVLHLPVRPRPAVTSV
jgi:cytochrome P450